MSTFQLTRLVTSGYVNPNPGPTSAKPKCQVCSKTIARNRRAVQCNLCGHDYHIKCGQVRGKEYKLIQVWNSKKWTCKACLTQLSERAGTANCNLTTVLPFTGTSLSDESFYQSMFATQTTMPLDPLSEDKDSGSHLSDMVQQLAQTSGKSLRVAH